MTAGPGRGGVVVVARQDGATAWYGAELTSVAGPGTERTATADVGFLTRQAVADGTSFALRWLHVPGKPGPTVALAGRADADSPAAALELGKRARARLAATPGYVHAEQITDDEKVKDLVYPFEPVVGGMGEVRKQTLVLRPGRSDARVAYYFGMAPLVAPDPDWSSLVRAVRGHPAPLCLSVSLTPYEVPAGYPEALARLAGQYAALGRDTVAPAGPISRGRSFQPGDPGALAIADLYTAAAARYRGVVFRVRIALASPAAFDDELLSLVGSTVSPVRHDLERPGTPADARAFRDTFVSLGDSPWGGHPTWTQNPPPAWLRPLTELVDPAEATAAFRLPDAAEPVGLPVLPQPAAGRAAAGRAFPLGRSSEGGSLLVPATAAEGGALVVGPAAETAGWSAALVAGLGAGAGRPTVTVTPGPFASAALADTPLRAPRLDAFAVPVGTAVAAHAAMLRGVLAAAFGLTGLLPGVLETAVLRAYERRGVQATQLSEASDEGRWPDLVDLVAAVWQETRPYERADPAACALLRQSVQGLLEGPAAAFLGPADPTDPGGGGDPLDLVERAAGRSVVVALDALAPYPAARAVVSGLLLQRATARPATLIVLDEPRQLLASPGGALLDLAASWLLGDDRPAASFVVATGDSSAVPPRVARSAGIVVLSRLAPGAGRSAVAAAALLSADQEADLGTLPPRYAYVTARGLPSPTLAILDQREDR